MEIPVEELEMTLDTSYTFPELSDGVSKPNCTSEVINTCLDDYPDVNYVDHRLLSDNARDEYLYPGSLDEDLNDDQYLYNLHEDPYQDVNAAVIDFAALNSSGKHVHNDYSDLKVGNEDDVVKVEVQEEVFEENFAAQNAVVNIEAPAVKPPVGIPRKTPPTTKPVKRSAAHFDEETNEEIVNVESFDVQRPRKAPKAKPAPRASAKKAPSQKRKVYKPSTSKPNISIEDSHSPSHFQAIDPLNPHGYVMRQAKIAANKKIVKTKKSLPDTSDTFPKLSDSVSEPNCIAEVIDNGLDDYPDIGYLDHLLISDNALEEDLCASSCGEDLHQGDLNVDQYSYNLFEEPYQDVNAAALNSSQVLISPDLGHTDNPNEIFPNQILEKNDGLKLKVGDDDVLNNASSGESGGEIVQVKVKYNVYNEDSYVKVGNKDDVVKVEGQEEEFEENFAAQNAVVKIEAPAVKRPVGRPRKTPPTTKPVKRSAAHFDEETNEEIVDVESFDVKRPRKAPKAKPAPRVSAKKAHAQKRKVSKPSTSKPNISIEDSHSPSHFQAVDPLNPNGYVMRQAQISALKNIAKPKKSPTVSRSKRSYHNEMEKKRRDEMSDLFKSLKKLVPTELLVDVNNKIKKNPSKKTILVGSTKYVQMLYENKKRKKKSAVKKNRKLQKKHSRLAEALNKTLQ